MTFTQRFKKIFSTKKTKSAINFDSIGSVYLRGNGLDFGSSPRELEKQYKNLAYSCINLRAHSTAVCEPLVFQKTNQSEKEEPNNHALVDIFDNPNPDQSYYDLLFETVKNLDLFGKCYWYVVRNNFGEPVEFYILPTSNIRKNLKNGIVDSYSYLANGREEIKYTKDEIIHFKYDSTEKGIIEAGAVVFQIENAINDYQKRHFENDARPPFSIVSDNRVSEVEFKRMKEAYAKEHAGADNAGKTLILANGFKPFITQNTPRESDFVETWKIIQTRTLSLFGVHPALVGIIEDVNRANAMEAQTIFTDRTIAPIVKRIDTTMTRFARNAYNDLSLKICHKIEAPSDRTQQLKEMEIALQHDKISTNEFREWLGNYDPVKNGDVIGKVAV